MKKVTFQIVITASKIMSVLVLVAGTWVSLALKDAGVFMTTIAGVSAILGLKQTADAFKKKLEKKVENNE